MATPRGSLVEFLDHSWVILGQLYKEAYEEPFPQTTWLLGATGCRRWVDFWAPLDLIASPVDAGNCRKHCPNSAVVVYQEYGQWYRVCPWHAPIGFQLHYHKAPVPGIEYSPAPEEPDFTCQECGVPMVQAGNTLNIQVCPMCSVVLTQPLYTSSNPYIKGLRTHSYLGLTTSQRFELPMPPKTLLDCLTTPSPDDA